MKVSDAFQMYRTRTVKYQIVQPSGQSEMRVAHFTKSNGHYFYDVVALRAHLEAAIGEDVLTHLEKLDQSLDADCDGKSSEELNDILSKDRLPSIPQSYLKSAFWLLCDHLRNMENIEEILKPLGVDGALLFSAIRRQINFTFEIAITLREGVLEEQHLADALRGKAVVSGGNRGGCALGKRNKAQAVAWKNNFGVWLQPFIAEEVAKSRGRGISRDRAAEVAEKHWPETGFAGLPGLSRQIQKPSRPTLTNALRALEKSGVIDRKIAPKGRKPKYAASVSRAGYLN